MFNKILIANRGEIACRVIRTARKLGIKTVAVYSDADAHSQHVAMADEAVHIGPAPSKDSYLQADRIIDVALKTGAQAIHPGYGFLSENADFCRACDANGIAFIGPGVEAIEAMGSKSAAKRIMENAGVPLVPGYHGNDQTSQLLQAEAQKIGYPVLLKATAGGGGKGMRVVNNDKEFDQALAAAKREALNGFGDDTMLVEKYLTQPRHVEIQVFCDSYGNGVYLFERDCSVQRRHQKVIEEAPAPGMTDDLRAAMGDAALRAAQAINYCGAGTVEFLLDIDGSFYFMEMNTRLQVEHPVTEMITGQDLVEWQLRVAAQQTLPCTQQELTLTGHAFEARIYAEDPDNDFLPQTGRLDYLRPPASSQHIRVDSGVRQGDEVSVYYDPMIAKLIVWDENRERALQRLCSALKEYRISGVTTNIDFLYRLASAPAFNRAELDTGFIDKHHAELFADNPQDIDAAVPVAALYLYLQQQAQAQANSPWAQTTSWRLNQTGYQTLALTIHDNPIVVTVTPLSARRVSLNWESHTVEAEGEISGDSLRITLDGYQTDVSICQHGNGYSLYTGSRVIQFAEDIPDFTVGDTSNPHGSFTAPMNGTIVALLVEPGQAVTAGDTVMVMEAMKMEHAIKAPTDGCVSEFYFSPGDLVSGGDPLLTFEPAVS